MSEKQTEKPVVIIGGPTASGKSGLALYLAQELSGVIINADSMQVYRGLPILTAQPPQQDKELVEHRLYEILEPEEVCDAVTWRNLVLEEIEKIHKCKKLPIIVGGTGFYLRTLLKGISPIPDVPLEVREKINSLQQEMGTPAFYEALLKKDPVMARKLDPSNSQRLVRAWEVLESTGKSLSVWQEAPRVMPPAHLRFLTIVLQPPRDFLYKNCNDRFEQMLNQGALDEVKDFRCHYPLGGMLEKAVGFREFSSYLNHEISLEEAVSLSQKATRHYAKRQTTWFRHQIEADLVLENIDKMKEEALDYLKKEVFSL